MEADKRETIAGMILAGIYTHEGMPCGRLKDNVTKDGVRTERIKEAIMAMEELLEEMGKPKPMC